MSITFNQLFTQQANGKSFVIPWETLMTGSVVAAAANSGNITASIAAMNLGTTYPNTLQGFQFPPFSGAMSIIDVKQFYSSTRCCWVGWFYKIGTANLAASPVDIDCFTHDAATFPVLRTRFGQASQPVPLIPLLQVTVALTTTAAQFLLKTTAGGAGYVDQDGNNVVGTKTFTMPSATTSVQTTLVLRLEDTDVAVRDITQMSLIMRATAGTATIWGFEPLFPLISIPHVLTADHALFNGMLSDCQPAVATSGTVSAVCGILNFDSAASVYRGWLTGVMH